MKAVPIEKVEELLMRNADYSDDPRDDIRVWSLEDTAIRGELRPHLRAAIRSYLETISVEVPE